LTLVRNDLNLLKLVLDTFIETVLVRIEQTADVGLFALVIARAHVCATLQTMVNQVESSGVGPETFSESTHGLGVSIPDTVRFLCIVENLPSDLPFFVSVREVHVESPPVLNFIVVRVDDNPTEGRISVIVGAEGWCEVTNMVVAGADIAHEQEGIRVAVSPEAGLDDAVVSRQSVKERLGVFFTEAVSNCTRRNVTSNINVLLVLLGFSELGTQPLHLVARILNSNSLVVKGVIENSVQNDEAEVAHDLHGVVTALLQSGKGVTGQEGLPHLVEERSRGCQ